jgi:hypothetical protein
VKTLRLSFVFLLVVAMLVSACDGDNGADPDSQPVAGKITAIASGIAGQDGKTLGVGAYDYDWRPGSPAIGIAGHRTRITGDNFASSEVLLTLDDQREMAADEKVFDPGTYSVVFYIVAGDAPPEAWAEVRVVVDGDVNATAPAWADWVKR